MKLILMGLMLAAQIASAQGDRVATPSESVTESLPTKMRRIGPDMDRCASALEWLRTATYKELKAEGGNVGISQKPNATYMGKGDSIATYDSEGKVVIYRKDKAIHESEKTCNINGDENVDDFVAKTILAETKDSNDRFLDCEKDTKKPVGSGPRTLEYMLPRCFRNEFQSCKGLGPKTDAAIAKVLELAPNKQQFKKFKKLPNDNDDHIPSNKDFRPLGED